MERRGGVDDGEAIQSAARSTRGVAAASGGVARGRGGEEVQRGSSGARGRGCPDPHLDRGSRGGGNESEWCGGGVGGPARVSPLVGGYGGEGWAGWAWGLAQLGHGPEGGFSFFFLFLFSFSFSFIYSFRFY